MILRELLEQAGILESGDTVQREVLNFACQMEARIKQKQGELQGIYHPNETLENWQGQSQDQNNTLLLAIGKNVSELAKANADHVVPGTAAVDVANLALIVDHNLRTNYGS